MIWSVDARSGERVEEVASETTPEELDRVVASAAEASRVLRDAGRDGRSRLLHAIADALEAGRAEIVALADRETGLGLTRLESELTRTSFQLRFFAKVLDDGAYLEATIDHAGDSPMGPRPDLRRILRPLGPVGVFGASNFPLAFSVAGGDTASALAAGCAVVVKAHPAHPATARRCGEAIAAAARQAEVDERVVSLVYGEPAGIALVQHPTITAVGFTGSLAGGRYFADLAAARPSPIPFYGELGAQNAVLITPGAAAERTSALAADLAASFSLGVGQFCTKPGLALLPAGKGGDHLLDALVTSVRGLVGGPMLTATIADRYASGVAERLARPGVRVLATGASTPRTASWGEPTLLEADPEVIDGELAEECFGPVLVVVRYRSKAELASLVDQLKPGLTGTVHATEDEAGMLAPLLDTLVAKVGRIVWNGYPTGVAVTWAMHHGGAYPATTDPLHTSVGATAIRRWLRPIAYQNAPEWALPAELRDVPESPHAVPRRVDGRLELPGA